MYLITLSSFLFLCEDTLQIDNPISPTVAVVGSSLTLSCTSRRSPPNTFTWRRVYLNLFLQSTRIIALDYTNTSAVFRAEYTIHNITTSDSDIYDCIAENPRSSAIRGIRVDVNGKLLTTIKVIIMHFNYVCICNNH